MNYIIGSVTVLIAIFSGWYLNQQVLEQNFGAFSDPFLSIQLAGSPANGYILQTDGTNNSWVPATAGGGGGGGTWATSTSQVAGRLVNYPNNTTDIVLIGGTATTTGATEWWFDPNTKEWLVQTSSTTFNGGQFRFNGTASTTALTATSLCLTGDTCIQTWPTGGGAAFPFTPTSWGNSTTTAIGFLNATNGIIATASSTFAYLGTGAVGANNGRLYNYATTTYSTGLTYSGGAVTVNTSQNIATLSNLTSNGLIYTSGGVGTLNVDSGALDVIRGGTGLTTFGGTDTVLYTTAADTLASEAAFSYSASANRLTFDFGSTTALSISGGLNIPANKTVSSLGEVTIDATSGQLRYSDGASQLVYAGFVSRVSGYSTSTAWTGTTTQYVGPFAANVTVKQAYCDTPTGTVGVSLYDGTNRADFITASSTVGTFNFSTNNTFTKGESVRVDFGTPASSPTQVVCTFKFVYDPD